MEVGSVRIMLGKLRSAQARTRAGPAGQERTDALPHMGRKITDVQELKQAPRISRVQSQISKGPAVVSSCLEVVQEAGGTSMIRQTIHSLVPSSARSILLVDLHGYDIWPGQAMIEENQTAERSTSLASIIWDRSAWLDEQMAQLVFQAGCKYPELHLSEFPRQVLGFSMLG